MEKNINKFNTLIPKKLKKNQTIYTEALDFAFSNKEIRNIAITGVYGAGKSTVWKTYIESKLEENKSKCFGLKSSIFKKIITVSIGKYNYGFDYTKDLTNYNSIEIKDSKVIESENSVHNAKGSQKDNSLESRIERQLINQILSQVKSRDIPFSKYKFKENISFKGLLLRVILTLSFLSSMLLWFFRDSFNLLLNNNTKNYLGNKLLHINVLLFIVPTAFFLYYFFRENKVKFSKVNLKGAEANFSESNNDETILERDIKELVYLITNSKCQIVVFEDLDRFDSADIFNKLRELNFLLNSYIKTNGDDKIVRFIYMVKDGLFFSTDRTKFFDFILPVVPIIDSKTSENELLELLKNVESSPDRSLISDISLYIDDMRLLKNIVNEYIVYSKVIPLNQIELEKNKLFALITLKNIFPNEFDSLQKDRGFIKSIIDKIENYKKKVVENLNEKLKQIDDKIIFLCTRMENDKFKAMTLLLPSDISTYGKENKTMSEFLKEWSNTPDDTFNIRYSNSSTSLSYTDFVDKYILTNEENRVLISNLPNDFSSEIKKLNSDKNKIEKQIKNIEIFSYKDIIQSMTIEQREDLFSSENSSIIKDHYFPLIRFLIVEGLLDETYWYYKGNFNIENSNTLKRNDTIYIKGLKEGKSLNFFLDLESPMEIINRLSIFDFSRDNILNKRILETCIEDNRIEFVLSITDSVDTNDQYEDLIKILAEFEFFRLKAYIDILLDNNLDKIINILELSSKNSIVVFENILISVLTSKNIDDNLDKFRDYIEQNENIINLIPEEFFDIFLVNVENSNIKFSDLTESEVSIGRLIEIEKIHSYKLTVKNIIFIIECILKKQVDYGNILNVIYNYEQLNATKEYLGNNFSSFIIDYIDEAEVAVKYINEEQILVKILNSEIEEKYKVKYLDSNNTTLSKLNYLNEISKTENILDCLFSKNIIKFSSENIFEYWDIPGNYTECFVEYIGNNLNETNYKDILKNNVTMCNTLINDSSISNKIFGFLVEFADKKIDELSDLLAKDNVNLLVKENLIAVNENNLEVLIKNLYYEELTILVNNFDQIAEDDNIDMLLKIELPADLIYSLINSNISDENAIRLVDLLEDRVLIEKIDISKKTIIEHVLEGELSYDNISFICNSFEIFDYKESFIKSLNDEDKWDILRNENLNKKFMEYVLNSLIINTDSKIKLILIKIKSGIEINDLKLYINSVDEIKDLCSVWEGKYPGLDNEYKEKVGKYLINFGYVKLRKNNKIMISNVNNKSKK